MEDLQMYDVMLCPICAICGGDFVFKIEDHSVTAKCGCVAERFLFARQYAMLEAQDDPMDRSIVINFMGFIDKLDAQQLHYAVHEIREKYFPGIDLSSADKMEVRDKLKAVKALNERLYGLS